MRKNLFLPLLCLAAGVPAATAIEARPDFAPEAVAIGRNARMTSLPQAKTVKSKRINSNTRIDYLTDNLGRSFKRLRIASAGDNRINPVGGSRRVAREASAPALLEGFEGYDAANPLWQPEGWTVESDAQEAIAETTSWFVYGAMPFAPAPIDQYYECVLFSNEERDEYLITPEITIPEDGGILSYYGYVDPIFLFNLDSENVDWNTMEFINKVMTANVQVLIREAGADEWTTLYDYFENYGQYSLADLYAMSPTELQQSTISLADYAGKNVQIAFRYYGVDGNTVFIDEVMVGFPPLVVNYSQPFGTLFYGVSKDLTSLTLSIPVGGVYTPLTWANTSDDYDATYSWMYHSAETNNLDVKTSFDLEETYYPDYTSEFTTRNNLYYTPTLMGEAPGFSAGSVQHYDYYQTGGQPIFELTDSETQEKSLVNFGLSTFDVNTEDMSIMTTALSDGFSYLPLYGYNEYSDAYWTAYTFGDEPDGGSVKLQSILNYYFPMAGAPLVIDSSWILAYGLVGENANFRLDVIPLSDEGIQIDPIATAFCSGKDIINSDPTTNNTIVLPFTFESPVVLSADEYSAYVIKLTGFNDPENVTYFAPYQSKEDNPEGYALGWIEKVISTPQDGDRTSVTPLANYTGLQSFAIMLGATHPWLASKAEETEITLTADAPSAKIALDSYYDASELTVTDAQGNALPGWLSATVAGRYDKTELSLAFVTIDQVFDSYETTVRVKGPGVSYDVNVKFDKTNSITNVENSNKTVVSIHSISGVTVKGTDTDNLAPGVYVVKYSDGTSVKITK